MDSSRLEAFSVGVMAVIINRMVLGLKAPAGASLHDLRTLLPHFLIDALSGASGKFRPPLEAVQCRASCAVAVAGVDPTQRDVCGHSSRLSPSAPPPRPLARSGSVAL